MKTKKWILVTGLALIAAQVHSQEASIPSSAAQVYGIIDMSLNVHRFSGTATRSGTSSSFLSSDTSLLGFRATESLGGGLKTYFKLETGYNADTGQSASATQFFNREAYIGLGDNALGSIQIGSQWTPSLLFSGKVDPFVRRNIGAILTIVQQGPTNPFGFAAQYQNALQYISPVLGGFSGRLMISAGEGSAVPGTARSGSLEYEAGPFFAGMTFDQLRIAGALVGRPAGSAAKVNDVAIGVGYRFPWARLSGYVNRTSVDDGPNAMGYMMGAAVPLGNGEIRASVSGRNTDNTFDADARLFALNYTYFLSKRTSLYTSVARLNNEGRAAFGIWPSRNDAAGSGRPAVGEDISGFQVGLRHSF